MSPPRAGISSMVGELMALIYFWKMVVANASSVRKVFAQHQRLRLVIRFGARRVGAQGFEMVDGFVQGIESDVMPDERRGVVEVFGNTRASVGWYSRTKLRRQEPKWAISPTRS